MKTLSEYLFEKGYFPLVHSAVKQDFISWFYEASKAEAVTKGLNVENSRLSQLAQDAQTEAEHFDRTNPLTNLISTFEEWVSRVDIVITYIAIIGIIIGGAGAVEGVLQFEDNIMRIIISGIAGIFGVSSVILLVVYKFMTHQIKTGSEIVVQFNQELSAKPGNIRTHDQDWNKIAARYFWNKSLLSPSTHICLIVLSVIRVISVGLYGRISAILREEVKEFVGMNAREIFKHEIQQAIDGELPPWPEEVD